MPAVAEFSAERLAAVVRVSPAAMTSFMAEALELRHRLPTTLARVEALDVALWRARRVAKATQGLSPQAVAHVDAAPAPVVDLVGPTRIDRAVAEAVALFDPSTLEAAEEDAAADPDSENDLGVRQVEALGQVLGLGPATLARIRDWRTGSSVTVLPALDMARTDSIDAHDPPRWMHDLVTRRDQHCVFPFCDTPATRCDLDHIAAYVPVDEGGPPGQTHPGNLAPICRHHHRAKTRERWTYHRTDHGDHLWRDEQGRSYAVTVFGTFELAPGRPATPRHTDQHHAHLPPENQVPARRPPA